MLPLSTKHHSLSTFHHSFAQVNIEDDSYTWQSATVSISSIITNQAQSYWIGKRSYLVTTAKLVYYEAIGRASHSHDCQ